MTPRREPKSEPYDDVLHVIDDFEQLSTALQEALRGLKHQLDSEQIVPPLERALEKAKLGAELARALARKLPPSG